MTEQDWKRALELYETASDLPKSVAQALLDSSNEDPAVVDQVCKMLSVTPESEVSSKTIEPHRFADTAIGRYDVIDLLGRGSTAEVYAGRDRDLGRLVALKIISAEYGILSSAPQRFMREARASSALNHPNIVTVHEVVVWNSLPVIVMELVDGKPLRTLCNTELPFESGTRIGCQMLEALSFAHANGIVHRDLKPENIMVRSDGYVKVLDFGLARSTVLSAAAANGTGEGSFTEGLPLGTLRYMSPEQCRGESATPASDVFAAGIVLYEMLAGRHPFYADSPLDTAHAIAWLQPTPLRQVNSEIPDAVNSLVMRMLEKDAGERPSSQEAARSLTISSARSTHSRARSKPAYWLYAAISAALVVAIVGSWLERSSAGAKNTPNPREPDLTIAPLASLLGVERMPDLSPDGARVAFEFSSENNPVSHIYVKELATSKLTQLTSGTLPDIQPVFSPEGSRLAFLRREGGKLDVMLMRSEGGIERKVAELGDSRLLLRIISWDGDGANLIVSEGLGESEARVPLFAISVVTGGKRQITFPNPREIDCMPVVSPDGRALGFARIGAGGSGRLWTIPLTAALAGIGENQRQQLTGSTELISCWNWTYDGRSLLVSIEKGGRTNLWRYPSSRGVGPNPPVRVEGLNDEVIQTSVSRLSSRFVYAVPPTQNSGLWSYPIPASTEAPKRIIASARMDVDPRFSPDGKNIAFASARSGFGQVDLWISASDGANQRQITSFGGREPYSTGSPNWSPDGRWIAFDAGPGHPSSVYVLDVLGGKPRQITDPVVWAGVPSWSSDGHWIYFCSDRGGLHNIWKVPAFGGASVQITHNGGFESFEPPGGRFLYYTKYFHKPGIWRMALPNGTEERVAGLEGVNDRNWVGCSRGIYFLASFQHPVLEFFGFSSGRVNRVRDLVMPPSSIYRGVAVAPNGRSMLYLQLEPGRANIMFVSNFH